MNFKQALGFRNRILDLRNEVEIREIMSQNGPTFYQADNIHEYIIKEEDFLRNTPQESRYLLKYKATILELFRNQCAICFNKHNGLEMDHYLIPKSKGGNFELIHRSGHKVNNAIPLCTTCNRKKQDKDYRKFCNRKDIKRIKSINEVINRIINS